VNVQVRSLDMMAGYVSALDKEQFAEQFPGFYLVPMGLLTGEEIADGNPAASIARNRHPERTTPLHFGRSPRHSMGKPHPLAGQMFQFAAPGEAQMVMGRGEHCNICVPDESVSEEHCQLQVVPEGLVIVDRGSTNGTGINLRRLLPDEVELLSDGDMLTVGRYSFQLLSANTLYSTLALIRALDVET
jgi:hypothetical protein